MTNTLALLTVFTTNWLPMTIERPLGNGTTEQVRKEVGVVVRTEFAQFYAGGRTNKVLVDQQIVHSNWRNAEYASVTNVVFSQNRVFTIVTNDVWKTLEIR